VTKFWKEATYGAADVSLNMHQHVVALPSPLSTYIIRARPKIVTGFGAAFPVAFAGGRPWR
jgi:hypothetical protein